MTFVTTTTAAVPHGVYGIERRVPRVIAAIGTGVAACVGQFPWGPEELTTPETPAELINKYMPDGCDRVNSPGCAALAEKSFPTLKVVRVLGTAAEKAAVDIAEAGSSPADIVGVEAKYKGVLGNSIVITISAASNADADSFKLTATLTGSNGTTVEVLDNIDFSEADAAAVDCSACTLIGAVTQLAEGRPENGDSDLTGGTDGTIIASDYVGTANASNRGIALLETDRSIRHVFVDDCGDSLRAAVNAGLQAHGILMSDREVYIQGDKGMTATEAQTDKLNYSSERVFYCDPWVKQFVDGQMVETVPSAYVAAVASKIPPSLSCAWKGKPVGEMLAGIKGLVTPRGAGILATLSAKGINTFVTEEDGSFRIESENLGNFVTSPETATLSRRRMTDYIVISAAKALRPYTDAPNIRELWDEETILLSNFLNTLKGNKKLDVFSLPFIVDFKIDPVAAANPAEQVAQNKFQLPFSVQTAASQSWIYLLATIGPTVVITEQPS